jgi:hypothetical protein
MAYAAQFLINFLSGIGDATITDGSQAMRNRGLQRGIPSAVVNAPAPGPSYIAQCANIGNVIRYIPCPWRLYLRGHGSRANKTLGSNSASRVAQVLVDCGIANNPPAIVSVTGCRSAMEQHGQANSGLLSANNFVAELHRVLGASGIGLRMYGRTMNVNVRKTGPDAGRKRTRGADNQLGAQRGGSKVIYWWDNGAQQGGFVNYSTPMDIDDDDAMEIDDPGDWMEVD